ncbi:MAG: hypothetical protein KatS3mg102_0688 [Planctomycetota bacterium]|nr:MAG: hypothetical protein KatS3mg102_0688 [Planctomycetota bacterium]
MRRRRTIAGLLAVGAMLAALPACQIKYRYEVEPAGTAPRYSYAAGGFIRYDGYDDVAGDMEIASVDYRRPGSETVLRLTGVIHIGDPEYYRVLQQQCLDTADVVLFEGVKFVDAAGRPIQPDTQQGADLGAMYTALGRLLGLGFQKDGIDYEREHFVHCDVTVGPGDPLHQQVDPAQIRQAIRLLRPLVSLKDLFAAGPEGRRTEDAIKHFMVTAMMMQIDAMTDDEARRALEDRFGGGGTPPALRGRAARAAEALRRAGGLGGLGMPPAMREQVLERRNAYVLERLRERLAAADPARPQTIAVFYGAAHMPGIAAALMAEGWQPVRTVWLRAWSMNSRGGEVVAAVEGDPSARPRPAGTEPGGPRPPARRREPVLY